MDIQLALIYFAFGHLIGLGTLGPAVFTAVINSLAATGRIGRAMRMTLLLLQLSAFLVALVFAAGFFLRMGKSLEHPATYRWVMTCAGMATMVAVLLALAYLDKMIGRGRDVHGNQPSNS